MSNSDTIIYYVYGGLKLFSKKVNYWLKLIASFGYPGLFFGLIAEFLGIPFPGEIVLTFSGFLVWSNHMGYTGTILAAVTGSVIGTVVAYNIGRFFGRPFLDKYGGYVFLNQNKIAFAERLFNRHNIVVLLFGRFIPGVRPLSAYIAGIARMRLALFFPLSLIGALIWCTTFITLGRYLGQNWFAAIKLVDKYGNILLWIAGSLIIAYILLKMAKREKRRQN